MKSSDSNHHQIHQAKIKKEYISLGITFLVGIILWFTPHPEAINPKGWQVLSIFIATIVGIILKPLPMGALAIIALSAATITNTLTVDQALQSYSKGPIWIIVIAFFISRGFMKTHLGTRIAYHFVKLFGKTSLGLAYSLVLSETLLAPAIPSITARTGGIIYPISNALSHAFGSIPNNPSSKRLGTFLILVIFQGSVVASAMFLTAMAANPIVVAIAAESGIYISWADWALAGSVPGIISLIIVPLVVYKICPPIIKKAPDAHELASKKLQEMGKMKFQEWVMLGVFIFLVVLWMLGGKLGVNSLVTALIGVSILLITRVLTFNELLEEKSAWGTLLWFGALLSLASYLNTYGIISYASQMMASMIQGMDWRLAFLVLSIFYFYSHYAFASSMAHVGAMYAAFLSLAILLGTPPLLAAFLFAFYSNLFGGLTHYGIGSAPVLFGSGYVSLADWWRVGLIVSFINLVIWSIVGSVWWKFLGLWGS